MGGERRKGVFHEGFRTYCKTAEECGQKVDAD